MTEKELRYLPVTEKELDAIAKTYIFEHLLSWDSLELAPPKNWKEQLKKTSEFGKGLTYCLSVCSLHTQRGG